MQNGQTSILPSLLLMAFFIFLIYFMMIRPQKKKDKADKEMRDALRVGDEIITIGGVVGKVEKITDKTVVISTGSQKNKIEFLKTAIASSSRGSGEGSKSDKSEDKAESKAVFEEDKSPDRSKKVTPKKLTKKSDSSEEAAAE